MKWPEHKFLVGPNGLNLNDAYKKLFVSDHFGVMIEFQFKNLSGDKGKKWTRRRKFYKKKRTKKR